MTDFKAWLKKNNLHFPVPGLLDGDFFQIEKLLVDVEVAAGSISDEEAAAVVAADSLLAENQMASLSPRWLVGAEAHHKWRLRITDAVIAGELIPLDFGSKLPHVAATVASITTETGAAPENKPVVHSTTSSEARNHWWNLDKEIRELKAEKAELEMMNHRGIPSEAIQQKKELKEVKEKLAVLEKRWEVPFPDIACPAPAPAPTPAPAHAHAHAPIMHDAAPTIKILEEANVQNDTSETVLRTPIADDIQAYLHMSFNKLPTAIAARIEKNFKSVIRDSQLDILMPEERIVRDVARGYSEIALRWDSVTAEQRNHDAIAADIDLEWLVKYAKQEDIMTSPQYIAREFDSDASMSASYWWEQPSIAAQEAASILCGFNPNSQKEIDFKNDYSGNTRPADYKKLLNAFEALERVTPKNRTLKDWMEYAQQRSLTIHSWLGEWIAASGVMRAPLATSATPSAPAGGPVTPAAVPILPPAKEQISRHQEGEQSMTHKIRTREPAILTAEINMAKANAPDPATASSVWGELTKLAESEFGIMIGFSSDGIQYRGRKYQATQVHDVFTIRNLRERMAREAAQRRVETH